PGFELPRTQRFASFSAEETYRPTPALYRTRAMIDAARVVLPSLLTAGSIVGFVGLMTLAWMPLPLWGALLSVSAATMLLVCAAILMAGGIKDILIGAYQPTVKPLWSKFVWLNELVNGVYESTA